VPPASLERRLVTVTGRDRPGIAAAVLAGLAPLGGAVLDVEQVQIHGRLLLGILLETEPAGDGVDAVGPDAPVQVAMAPVAARLGVNIDVERVAPTGPPGALTREVVTVLAAQLDADDLTALFAAVAGVDANVERIVQLSDYPVVSYQLELVAPGGADLRGAVGRVAAERHLDVAVQRAGLHRRARHLVVLDVDSTLVQAEVVDLLAAEAGVSAEVAAITEAAMAGRLDFADALRHRVALLAGLDAGVLDVVRAALPLTPGARTLVRTLLRLGFDIALVSGGFEEVIGPVAADLGISRVAANRLEVQAGRLTGRLDGPVLDRAGKAAALRRFARESGLPLERTVAVGDGANDLDMLEVAGLGIAFNAKPLVRRAADTSLSVPYLDAILFLLGVSRAEIEDADADSGLLPRRPAVG
jgi:phosphoserine phosphatase